MKTVSRIVVAFSSVALGGLMFAQWQGPASASSGASPAAIPAVAQVAAADTAPLVNLPDFSRLVEQAGPAVVNIEATIGGGAKRVARDEPPSDDEDGQDPPMPGDGDMPEFFKRFFGQPGGPGGSQDAPRRQGTSFGSGFVISPDGYVLTNHHVIDGASEVIVHFVDRRELKAKVIGSDAMSDVALLKVEATNLPVLRTSDSRNLKPGQWVLAIGSPFGFDHSVTAGVVSGLGRPSIDGTQQYVPFIQTDVAINRGNSGGPLLNTRGEVVGINSQIFSNSGGYMGVSFAIPIEVAMSAVQQLKASGKVTRAQLGVNIADVNRDQMSELGLSRAAGAYVAAVQNNSSAAKAGIRPGDVIVAFNGKDIGGASELPPLVGGLAPGSRASVKVIRDGKPQDIVVVLSTLVDATVADAGAAAPPAPASDLNALGLVVGPVDAATRGKLGLSAGEGVRIARVASLAARQAGLNPGDVVLQVGKAAVGSPADFASALKGVKAGDRVRLLVRNAQSTGLVTVVAQ
jgi:serine protease Do